MHGTRPKTSHDRPLENAGSDVGRAESGAAVLIVAGMHQSGLSLVESYLSSLGVDMETLHQTGASHLEAELGEGCFLELDRRMVAAATPVEDGGYRRWGYSEGQTFDAGRLNGFRDEARHLIETRSKTSSQWGWKDPLATLMLDFWQEVFAGSAVGRANFVLPYRSPWDVADSLQRLGVATFLEHPEYGYRIWALYNRNLIRFYRAHRDEAVLVCLEALVRQPDRFVSLLRNKLGIPLPETSIEGKFESRSLGIIGGSDPLIPLVAATEPECVELLAELDHEADLSGAGLWEVSQRRTHLSRPDSNGPSPVLSVVVPCYNDGRFLIEAVASVERSDIEDCELVIVNDGSSDGPTLEILELLRAAGNDVIDEENRGAPAARNRGIQIARGRYILTLDADNRIRPGFAAAAIEVLDRLPEVGVVYGDCLEFGMRSGLRNPPEFDLANLLRGNYIDTCAVFRKEAWEQAGGFDHELPAWDDWEFWINIASHGWQFHRLPDVCFEYRVRPGSNVNLSERPEIHEQIVYHVVRKHLELFERHLAEDLILWHRDVRARHRLAEVVREEVRARDREVSRLRVEADVRELGIADLRTRLEELDHVLAVQSENNERRQRDFQSLFGRFEEQTQRVTEQSATLDDLHNRVASLRSEIDEYARTTEELRGQLRLHRDALARVRSTFVWRVASVWLRVSDRLAPDGSIRRRLFNWITRTSSTDS